MGIRSLRTVLPALLALTLLTCWTACRGGKGRPMTTQAQAALDISGTWEARALEVTIHSKDNGPRDEELHFDTAEQSRLKGRKPQLTTIDPTGGYREETWTLHDSLLTAKSGSWHLHQDSVYFRLDADGSRKLAYGVSRAGQRLLLHTRVDYDGDGQKDDVMQIVLEKE
jgi:hypothetical protein